MESTTPRNEIEASHLSVSNHLWVRVSFGTVIACLAMFGFWFVNGKFQADLRLARENLSKFSAQRTDSVAKGVTAQFEIVYHYLHSIAQMPGVRDAQWTSSAFGARDGMELAELHSELTQLSPVSEIHLVGAARGLSSSNRSGTSSYEFLTVGAPKSGVLNDYATKRPVASGEAGVIRDLVRRLGAAYPTYAGATEHPALLSRPARLDEAPANSDVSNLGDYAIFYCVPAYNASGQFKGAVVAEFPLQELRDSLPESGFLLTNAIDDLSIGDIPARNMHLAHSEVRNLAVFDESQDWQLHSFVTDGEVATTGTAVSARQFRLFGNLLITLVVLVAVIGIEVGIRWPERLEREICEQRRTQLLLVQAREEADQAKWEAEKANLAKSEFLSRMSHELRTPMNAVLGYAQLLNLQYDEPGIKDAASAIMRGGKHLLEMINEVLDLSRIESGSLSVSVEVVSVGAVVEQAIGLVQPLAASSEIQLTVEDGISHELHAQADQQRLLQVLINLIANGIKYNRPGGTVCVRYSETPEGLCRIAVSDTGLGISLEDQELLFQPFQRFGDLGIEGTGLGLALSVKFATLMGGKLGLLESSREGSTFYVDLKTAVSVASPIGLAHTNAPLDTLAPRSGTVLYIEDNPSNMRLLESAFALWSGPRLISASQGLVGLELAREHHPDLILLDLHLPDMMGDKVLARLKADPKTHAIPVVILSADATQKQIATLLAAGAAHYITKPIDLGALFDVIQQSLRCDERASA